MIPLAEAPKQTRDNFKDLSFVSGEDSIVNLALRQK
jgi:hypothetical protein